MLFFWKILSYIYSDLVASIGLNIAPPDFLFYKPNKKIDRYSQQIVLADKNFTIKERKLILEAIRNLEYFCNGMIEINIIFELDSENKETLNNHSVLLRVDASHPSIAASDEKLEASTTLGLCEYMANDTKRLYLVIERLQDDIGFRTTTIHEFGHFIGLDHTSKPSIMYKHNNRNVLYPTHKDAIELAHKWGQLPNDFRYFML